jgi:hypothetical protein
MIMAYFKYFIYTADIRTEWFTSYDEWAAAVNKFDFYTNFCDDAWSDEVHNCLAGEVPPDFNLDAEGDEYDQLKPYATHAPEQFDRVERPPEDQLDGEGCDKQGTYWQEGWSYTCSYHFVPVVKKPEEAAA